MAPGRRVQVVHGPESLRPVPVLLMKLTVYYSPYYPPDRCWISEVRDGWRVFTTWRSTYPEALEWGLEDLAWAAGGYK